MSTQYTEDGTTYTIEDGRVVTASKEEIAPDPVTVTDLKLNQRVLHGKKLGFVVSLSNSMYGQAIGVAFDDGSFSELSPEDLEIPAPEKVAKVAGKVTAESFQTEYEQYQAMPTDTLEEVEEKVRQARALNLRAKALVTNRQASFSDQLLYDQIVTATAVDILDLEEDLEVARMTDNAAYFEQLPKFEASEQMGGSFGPTRGGDASWLGAIEVEDVEITDAELAHMAHDTVARLNEQALTDRDFMRSALEMRFESLPATTEVKTKFAGLVNQARKQKLAEVEARKTQVTAKVTDMEGTEVDLDDLPIEAIFSME